jgi:hypothetical protein
MDLDDFQNFQNAPEKIPGVAKIFFSWKCIKQNGLWRFDATRGLRRTRYLSDRQSSNYLDILKGVEKQSVNTNME